MRMKQRLSESPDRIKIKGLSISWEYGIAFAFIAGKFVWSEVATHATIFSSMRPQIGGLMPPTPASELEDEYIYSRPKLTDADIHRFSTEIWVGDQGRLRELTSSGRAWKKLSHDGEVFSAVSFWSRKKKTPPGNVGIVVNVLKLNPKGIPVYVEYVDSIRPEIITGGSNTREMKSKVAPRLTATQIIDILARAHTAPHTLSPLEQKVVKEFRGEPDAKPVVGGYATVAQWNNAKRIGDSLPGKARRILDSIRVDKS